MLSLSQSGMSHSFISSGYSESVDLEVVDEIIERSPRSATAFPVVYKAYVSVLQDNGISPADDTAYYQFLLKLQVIRAGTWGEKWDLWRATQLATSSGPPGVSPKVGMTPRLADVRAKVPFLAGASSDLDDAFGEGETSYSADAESTTGSETPGRLSGPTSRRVSYTPFTPGRNAFDKREEGADDSRSLVGYTPDHSVDLSGLGLDLLPARTSTPIYAHQQHRHAQAVHATPPPYSASVSQSDIGTQHYDLTEELIPGLVTPKARARDWEEDRILEEEVIKEMERRADQFYETGLMGRCSDVWAQANDWIQKTTNQIDTVRAHILLRQNLLKWKAEKDRVLLLPNTADAHRRQHLQLSALSKWIRRYRDLSLAKREKAFAIEGQRATMEKAWRRWRAELTKKRTGRWERDMKSREKRFVKARETVLVQDVLDRWRGETRTRIDTRLAVSVDTDRLLRQTFEAWHYRLEQKERLEGQLAVYQRTRDKRVLGGVWDRWVQEGMIRRAEAGWWDVKEERVKREIWDRWKLLASQATQADDIARMASLRAALGRWKKAHSTVKSLERKVVIFRQVSERAVLRQAFTRWTVAEREVLLGRVRDQRATKSNWAVWRSRLEGVRRLDDRLIPLTQAKNRAVLQATLRNWQTALSAQRTQLLRAQDTYNAHRLASAFAIWRTAARKIESDRDMADKARVFFVLRQVVRVWKVARERKRQEAWAEGRRVELMRRVFDEWRAEAKRSVNGKKLADEFRKASDQRLTADTLSQWTNRVIFLKSRQLDVSEARDARLLESTLSRWVTTRRRIADAQALADSFVIVKGEEIAREVFSVWRDNAARKRERREAAVLAEQRRRERLVRGAWEIWRDRAMERKLEPIEEEVGIRHEDAILFRVWDKWKDRATLLPAISFDNRRIKQKAWSSMLRAMDRAKAMKEFGGPRDHRLLEDVLAVWRAKTQAKVVARAGRLRGRHRPSLPSSTALPSAYRTTSYGNARSPILPPYRPSATASARPTPPQTLSTPRHIRSASTSHQRHLRTEPASPAPDDEGEGEGRADAQSVFSEPAYSRLRSELARPRSERGATEEPVSAGELQGVRAGRSDLSNALRGLERR